MRERLTQVVVAHRTAAPDGPITRAAVFWHTVVIIIFSGLLMRTEPSLDGESIYK